MVTAPTVPGEPGVGIPLMLAAFSVGVASPLALRRRFPVSVALVSVAVALLGTGVPGWPGRLAAAVALCSATYHRARQAPVLLVLAVASALTPILFATPLPGCAWPPGFATWVSPTPLAQGVLIAVARSLSDTRRACTGNMPSNRSCCTRPRPPGSWPRSGPGSPGRSTTPSATT